MHILILEARLTGHHPVYLEKIAESLMKAGHHVTVAIAAQDTAHPCLSSLRLRFSDSFSVYLIEDARLSRALSSRLGDPGREIAIRRLYSEIHTQVNNRQKIEHVLLPYLDYCLNAIALFGTPFGTTPWSGICMRPSFHYTHCGVIAPKPKYATVKEQLFFRLLRNRTLKQLFTIDELLYNHVIQRQPHSKSKIEYFPDPVELRGNHTRASARKALRIPENREVILIYGAIDARKGLAELLAAFEMTQMPIQVSLLVIGKQSPWATETLSKGFATQMRKQDRLWEIDRFVDDEEQQMVFAATDIVWLGYKHHYTMSGVLVLSAIAGKHAISANTGLIGWFTEKYSLGSTIDIYSPLDIIKSIADHFSKKTPNSAKISAHEFSWASASEKLMKNIKLNE